MDESISPVKSVKHPRGAKALSSEKASKEAPTQREGTKSVPRSKENLTIAKDEHNIGSQGSRGQGKTSTDTPQDRRRGRPSRLTRLTGRTSSGERGKGKVASSQQQLAAQTPDSRASLSTDSSPSASRETNSPVVPGTPEKGLAAQAKSSSVTPAKEKSHGVKAAGLMHQSIEEGTEVRPTVEEGPLSEQQLGLRQAEERLYRDYIHRLLKQSPEYPNYQYLCKLCSVHIENIQGAHKHIKEKRHKKNIMEKQEENELRALPPPTAAQLRAVDAAVIETARQHGISEEDFEVRKAVVLRMEKIIKRNLSACSLRLYGSCLTRFAFKTSDINIDVTYPSSMTQPEVLIQVLEILKNSSEFSEVESDFHAKVPAVFCRDVSSGLMCKVSAGNDVACLTTNHLAALAKLEPRLVPLVLAFRYWARLCHIDCQAEGGIPSYSFALMVIFFLQQRKEPILPVYLGRWIEGFDVKRVDEYHLTGITLDMFVRWEHRPPSSTEGRGENRNEARGQSRPKPEQNKPDDTHYSEGLTPLTFDLSKDVTLGQLWLELLRFYTLEFALEEYIISIRLKVLLSREVKNWPRRRLAIEDPFALKRNVARSLNSQMVFEYIQERFRTAYRYFACPQRKGSGGHQRSKKAGKQGAKLEGVENKEADSVSKEDNDGKGEKSPSTQRAHQGLKEDEEPDSDDEDGSDPSRKKDERTLDASLMDMVINEGNKPSFSPNGLLDSDKEGGVEDEEENSVSEKAGPFTSEDLHYVFDKMIFTGGKPPTVVCSICKRDGHLKDECPEDFKKIELKPLPPMNDRFRDILDGLCRLCYYELSPSPVEQQKREQILGSLERFIRKEYNDKAQLCLFGSSKNGFGFRDSDLDICMTLEGHDTAEKLNCKEIIEGLAKVLKKHTGLRNILPITTAKVPIVKFEHRQSGLEGDISLYNTLAQHNTRMLATYAALDPRVQFLGYTMKVFAKRCDIGDASRGSLSSYAYILMVLYFLQQRQPPVIPVLQEIFDGKTVPQRMVDGWNAFFFDDLEDLRRRLSALQPNTETVGELWLGLLRFYTEEFDFKEHVISIRQRKRLTTFEKQWTSKCIAIEDPFDLNHNLGAGVSRKMTNFIMKAFINGRKLFGTPFYPVPGTEVDYFFDSKVLTDGELAPNDRCCRICGKIGHYMKDCPKRRRMKKKENDKDEDIKEEEREPKDRRCFQCGDMGHVRRDCPEYRHLKQRTAGAPAPHMVRTMVSSQSIPIPQAAADCPGRTRQPSECSDSRQTPPYSPQPTAMPQSSSQSSSSPQPSHSKTSSAGPSKQPAHPQVPLSLFSFPTSLPGQYHPGTLTALGHLPSHQSQGQPHHPVHIPSTSWPIHGPVLTTSSPTAPSPPGLKFALRSASGNGSPTGSGGNSSPMNLNDPSIIFAQPAGRQLGIGGPGREGHWHNHLAQPGSLMGNGTVIKSESGHPAQFVGVSQGSRLWEHNKTPQYTLSPSWAYRMPQSFLQQGNGGYQPGKPFMAQGSMVNPNPNFPLVPHVRHQVNLNFIQQKK
ncbi:terminal uridylyltransferase 4 [Toxotes jaculatrix]|uniref:terminal uridylyltransferase 4 n=1 Tax=Toxotes jaculatrix TaxID=941984 RepID=UPI001B3AE3F8|nr:terminal uridylyltransferase 4 [Toxotes jaculatrix]XP_040896195.1 terminal uridylyltransferase 4 [Toxotes jaculatrix]XP_040896196.1 terminal uridylyltransferase 4 [Toxotes jaculatrix]XP_040896197.1 terminal uridylyltransferase 4 [Toxotes jaculatrix]